MPSRLNKYRQAYLVQADGMHHCQFEKILNNTRRRRLDSPQVSARHYLLIRLLVERVRNGEVESKTTL